MKKLSIFFISLLVTLVCAVSANAQTFAQKDVVLLQKDQVVDENYFAAGKSVTISGTINGDAYIAGENILIDGVINGDLLTAGSSITINGQVTGDVRAVGGQITIDGVVGGNVTSGSGSLMVSKNAQIGRGLVIGAGQVSLQGPVAGGATIGAGNILINNTIGGNVLAGVGQMSLSPNSVISGNLTYFAEEKASVQPGAVVAGKVEYHKQNVSQKKIENAPQQARQVMAAAGLGLKIYTAATLFLLGLVFIKFFPRFSARSIEIVQNQPMKAMGMGALMFFGLPVVAFLLFVSIIGIPFALFAIFLFSIYLYISKFFVALFIGKKLIDWFKWGNSLVLALFLGLVAWIVVTSLPVLGGLIQFIVILVGSGTLVMLKTEYLTTLKSKNLL